MPDPRHLLFDIVDRFVWPAFGGVFGGGVISRALSPGPAEKKC